VQEDDEYDTARTASLQIRLLGAPKINLKGAPVTGLTSAKAQGLLYYLAVTGRRYTRSALATLLWGDLSDVASRTNLRKALQQLRRTLGAYLAIERDTIALSRDAEIWVDVVEFDDTVGDPQSGEAPDRLQHAVDLYRGDLMEGFYVRDAPDFEDWWLSERARLRERMLNSLQALAEHRARQGDLAGAIAFIRRFLNFEPWREEAQRSLMTWLARSGQRGAALAQYEICCKVLADELAVEPAGETTALYERIRTDELKAPSPSHAPTLMARSRPPAFLDRDARPADRPSEQFVGHEPQLDRLLGFLGVALAGQGRVAFIAGEAGWGKTTLLREFSRRAQENRPDLIVASGLCTTYTGSGDPYLPFREVLSMLSGDVERQWATGTITRDHALRLWHLLPEAVNALANRGRNLIDTFIPGEVLLRQAAAHQSLAREQIEQLQNLITARQARSEDPGIDQARIFEEYTAVLQSLARKRPLLLMLDDLHWADASSIGLLFHLGRRLVGNSILILGTYRPEDVSLGRQGSEHPLARPLDEVKRLFGDVRVNLGQAARDGGRTFVDALLDREPNRLGEEFRQQLAQTTGGHPLFTVEMLRDMEERGQLCRDEEGRWIESSAIAWDTLPSRVEGVIERRVNHLNAELRAMLVTASVEGEEFTAEAVARVRKVSEQEMVEVLSSDLARKHALVRALGVQQVGERRISRYQFSHNLFQKYLYQTLDLVERTYLHEALGNALETLYHDQTEEIAPRLARHFQEAGLFDKAITYLKQAGDAAARVYANTEAIAHYRQAITLASQTRMRGEDLTLLYTGLGRALELDSQFDQVLATYEELEGLAHQRGDERMALASLMARSTIQVVPTAIHDPERARVLSEQALRLAEKLGDREAEAKILWSLSLADYFTNRLSQAIDYGERSLALARKLSLREQMAHTLNDLGGFIYMYSGRIGQARTALQEAGDLWRSLGNRAMLVDSLSGSCIAHVYAGEYERAIALSEQAFGSSQDIANLWGQSYSRWTIGDAFRARGEYGRAIKASEECIRLGELAGFLASQTYTRVRLAATYGDLGALERGIRLTETALNVAERHLRAHSALALGVMAHLHVLKGDLAQAETEIGEAKHQASHESWAVFYLAVLSAEAELALHRDNYDRAMAVTGDLLARLRHYGMRSGLPEALYLQGRALLGLGQRGAARDAFVEARAEAESLKSRRMLWRILAALGQLESDRSRAESLRREARQVVGYITSHIDQDELRSSFLGQPDVQAIVAAA
jgi:adenylate cyclase